MHLARDTVHALTSGTCQRELGARRRSDLVLELAEVSVAHCLHIGKRVVNQCENGDRFDVGGCGGLDPSTLADATAKDCITSLVEIV